MSATSYPFVSVIVPVYNDPSRLKLCLQALETQSYAKELYEVLVIDNGSDESIAPIVAKFQQAKTLIESRSGSYVARNTGVSQARGAILAFTDSDCLPAADWIERGVMRLLGPPRLDIIGGRIELFFREPLRPTPAELYDRVTNFDVAMYIDKAHFSPTANLLTFKSVFEKVGAFDGRLKSGGDLDWGRRATSLGFSLCYAADVRIAHPARYTIGEILAKEMRVAKGHAMLGWSAKRAPVPFRWSYESLMERLPPLPPVFRVMRFHDASPLVKISVLLLWCFFHGVQNFEKWRWTLKKYIGS